jgi:hypothetical protein
MDLSVIRGLIDRRDDSLSIGNVRMPSELAPEVIQAIHQGLQSSGRPSAEMIDSAFV